MSATWTSMAGALLAAAHAAAQAPSPSPSPETKKPVLIQGTALVGPRSARGPTGGDPSPSPGGAGKYDGSLAGVKALEIADGRARLLLGGAERVVTPGTVIGTDTVKSITPGRIVLQRAAPDGEGGNAIVLVTFDEQGRTRMMVIASKDPTTRAPAAVK